MMFGVIPGLITARLTGFLSGIIVGPIIMLRLVRHEQYRLPEQLTWGRAVLASFPSFLLIFAPLLLPDTTELLQIPAIRSGTLSALLLALLWFVAAFLLSSLVVAAALHLPYRQAVSWWGITFAATLAISWVAALGLTLLVRYAILPHITDFF